MKLTIFFTIIIFFTALIGTLVVAGDSIYSVDDILKERIQEHLQDIAKLGKNQVELFLKNEKNRVIDFSSDGFIKDRLIELRNNPSEEIMQELSKYLIDNKIVLDAYFYEVFVLDINGKVVGTTNPEEEFGVDFSKDSLFLEGKKAPYIKDIFYDEEFKRNGIALSAPISNEDEFVGVTVIRTSFGQLIEIITNDERFFAGGQIYLIDQNSLMLTPSRFLRGENKGVLTQVVDTESSKDCLEDIEEFYNPESREVEEHQEEGISNYKDYRGEEVVGVHDYLSQTKWCLLVEADYIEHFKIPMKNFILKQILISLIIVVALTLAGYFLGRHLDRRKKK